MTNETPQPLLCYCGHELARTTPARLWFLGCAIISQTVRLHCPCCNGWRDWHPAKESNLQKKELDQKEQAAYATL